MEDEQIVKLYWYCESVQSLVKDCSTTPNKLAGRIIYLREKLKQTLEREGICL